MNVCSEIDIKLVGLLLLLALPARTPAAPAYDAGAFSPRAAVARFLDLCREGRYDDAARLLDCPRDLVSRGPELARRLKAVLDRHVWFDLDALSDAASGDPSDGLAPELEEVGRIPGPRGTSDPVRLVRVDRDGKSEWLFAPTTLRTVDAWYGRLGNRWLLEHLPAWLLNVGPRNLLWWQWLALPLLALVGWLLALASGRTTTRLLARAAARTRAAWDDALVARLGGPIRALWWMAFVAGGVRFLDLYPPAQRFVDTSLVTGVMIAVLWGLLRSTDILGTIVEGSAWARTHPGARALLPLAVRSGKVGIAALAAVQTLSVWGFPVTTLLAGLGIGGLALALAAQKTVENLFGSFSIGVDQPFRQGDFVKIEDLVGTVESIGLRSTRIRTLDRTLVSLPNGKLADMRLESFTARDRIRLACIVSVVYGTSAGQMRAILAGLENVLRSHEKIWPDPVIVRFKELAAASLDIEVMAWFETADWGEFQRIRQEVLLAFMEVVESAGSSFAFPTQTIYLETARRASPRASPPAPPRRAAAGDRAEQRSLEHPPAGERS